MGLGYSTYSATATPDDYHFTHTQLTQKGTLFDVYQGRSLTNAEEKAVIFVFSKAKGPTQLKIAQNAVAVCGFI